MNCSEKIPAREWQPLPTPRGVNAAFPSRPAAKRCYDILFSACGLLALSPLFLVIAASLKLAQGGAVFFRQSRVGLHGRRFFIYKFRTMVSHSDQTGPSVTRDGDSRVTRIGRFLRKTKLDELPQLWNVLRGDMSLVGPRPEVPMYVERYTPEQLQILNLRPGITDLASICFRNEELLLKNAEDLDDFYLRHCVPRKLQLNLEYAKQAGLLSDTWIILQTICPYWICLLSLYALLLCASFWASCLLVYDFSLPPRLEKDFAETMLAIVSVQLVSLIWNKQCKGLLSYFSLPELRQVAAAFGFSCLLLLGLWAFTDRGWPPRNLILVDSLVSFCVLSGFRLLVRRWRESVPVDAAGHDAMVPVGIVGAGRSGSQLARELMDRKEFGRAVVAFFDDDLQKWHRYIHDIPVVGRPECLLDGWTKELQEVIIAMPNAPASRVCQVCELIQRAGLKAYTAPSVCHLWPKTEKNSVPRIAS